MVLLIPKAVQKIRDEGRAEGHAEGQAAEREAQHARREEAYHRFGIAVNGIRSLPDTPEVRNFLNGKEENRA